MQCGYCYVDLDSEGVANGSCLPTSPDNWLQSTAGRCQNYSISKRDDLVWAYDFCPTRYYWLPMVGLISYLIFFAPGETNNQCYVLVVSQTYTSRTPFKVWDPCRGQSMLKYTRCGRGEQPMEPQLLPTGSSICSAVSVSCLSLSL